METASVPTVSLRVAGAQIPVQTDIEANRKTLLRAIDFAAKEKADVLLTPDGSLSGYTHDFDTIAATKALAEVTSAARAASLGLALGTCFVEDDGRAVLRLFDRGLSFGLDLLQHVDRRIQFTGLHHPLLEYYEKPR